MSKLKPDLPANITIGDKYGPAMKIADQAEADEYFDLCVRHTMSLSCTTRAEAEAVNRESLGYYAGYFDNETRARVERLFRCEHPVFGAIAKHGPPDPRDALIAGMMRGRQARERDK